MIWESESLINGGVRDQTILRAAEIMFVADWLFIWINFDEQKPKDLIYIPLVLII